MVDSSEPRSLLFRFVRGVVVLVGVAVFAVGLLIVFAPETARLLPVGATIRLLGSDYFVVAAVGLAAVALAGFVLLAAAVRGVDESIPPVVESIPSAPRPGRVVDRAIDGRLGRRASGPVRTRLREAAVRTLVRREHCSRSAAERRVDEGTWTDDDVAAAYLRGGDGAADSRRGILARDDRVRRTVRAIERIAAPEDDVDASGDGGDGETADADEPGRGGIRSRSGSRSGPRERRETAGTGGGFLSDPAEEAGTSQMDAGGAGTGGR